MLCHLETALKGRRARKVLNARRALILGIDNESVNKSTHIIYGKIQFKYYYILLKTGMRIMY